jgi:hypothetical protein
MVSNSREVRTQDRELTFEGLDPLTLVVRGHARPLCSGGQLADSSGKDGARCTRASVGGAFVRGGLRQSKPAKIATFLTARCTRCRMWLEASGAAYGANVPQHLNAGASTQGASLLRSSIKSLSLRG